MNTEKTLETLAPGKKPPEADAVVLEWSVVHDLAHQAATAPSGRVRECLHRSTADAIQEMVIAVHESSYVRPHRHPGNTESFHMIDGKLTVVLFEDDGAVLRLIRLGDPQSGRPFLYRLNGCHWHTVLIESEVAVFHETVGGPFEPAGTEFATWSPAADDLEGAVAYQRTLRSLLTQALCEQLRD